jgi:HK97 family phage major capsid protein
MKFKKDKDGKLILDAAGNPVQELAASAGDEMVMTKEQLDAHVASLVHAQMTPDQIALAVEPVIKKYLESNGTKGSVRDISFAARDIGESKVNSYRDAAALVLDAFDRASGNKPRFGTDLDKAQELSAAYIKRTGMKLEHAAGGILLSGQSTSNTVGGYGIKTEEILSPVDLVGAPQGIVERCNNIPMQTGKITIVTLDGDITVTVTPETADADSEATQAAGLKPLTGFTLGRTTLTRYTITAVLSMTRQQMQYDLGYMENLIRTKVPARIWSKLGKLILSGSGSAYDYITGLDGLITGANQVDWNAAFPFDGLMDLIAAPELALPDAAETDTLVTNKRGELKLRRVKDKNEQYIMGAPGVAGKNIIPCWGYDLLKTNQVLSTYPNATGTDTRIYAGDFKRHAHVGVDPNIVVLVNPFPGSGRTNRVEIIFEANAGFQVSSASAFAYMDIPR